MPTNTTTYSFQKPVVGADEDSWGGYLNSNWDKVDDLFDGTTAITGIDINSGTIDGTVIGGTTPAAISGTTGQFDTSLNVDGTVTADGLTVGATVPIVRLDSPATVWVGGEDLGGVDWYTEDTSGSGPAVMARIYSESSGANTLPIPNMIFQTSLADVALKDRMQIAGNGDISFYEDTGTTPKFFWDASAESLGIGVSSPDTLLHLNGGASSPELRLQASSLTANIASLKLENSSARVVLGSSSVFSIAFDVNGSERMRIDSSGNLLVGKTAANTGTTGIQLVPNGLTAFTRSGDHTVRFNRLTSDGDVVVFQKDGTTVGSIGAISGDAYIATGDVGLRFDDGNNILRPVNSSGADVDNSINIGGPSQRFKSAYLSGIGFFGVTSYAQNANGATVDGSTGIVRTNHVAGTASGTWYSAFLYGGTTIGSITQSGTSAVSYNTSSDYRLKEDVQPMVGASDRVLALKPVNFAWKADGTRVDGFLAHEAQEVVPEAVHGTKDAMRTEEYEVTPAVLDDEGNVVTEAVMGTREVPDYQGIDQSKLVPLLTAALQEALTEITDLKARVAALEGN